jgi:hypothetical protein
MDRGSAASAERTRLQRRGVMTDDERRAWLARDLYNQTMWASMGSVPIFYSESEKDVRRDAPVDDPIIPVMDVLQLEKWFAKGGQ